MAASYLTVDVFRTRSGIPATVDDGTLAPILEAVEFQIEHFIGFSPASTAVTEYYDGNGTQRLPLEGRQPITAVASVYENYQGWYQAGNFTATELLTVGTSYAVELFAGKIQALIRIGSVWPVVSARTVNRLAGNLAPCLGSVAVTYTAGLNATQMQLIANAGYMEAAAQYSAFVNGMGTQNSASMDGYSLSITPLVLAGGGVGGSRQRFISPVAEAILRPFKRTVFSK